MKTGQPADCILTQILWAIVVVVVVVVVEDPACRVASIRRLLKFIYYGMNTWKGYNEGCLIFQSKF